MASYALITTTINVPELLFDYARDAKEHGHTVKICVTGDRKTPTAAIDCCDKVAQETKVECEYLDVDAQQGFMAAWPQLDELLPWNCVQRRNVAILKAYLDGADTIITIDDDNKLAQPDYFGHHACVGQEANLPSHGKGERWFNICRFLTTANGYRFVARGYGMEARAMIGDESDIPLADKATLSVAVNAGLWLGDPDIDAVTRLAHPLDVTGYTLETNFFVAPSCMTPFNSQNTALARAALPAYFLSPDVGRFDDIFASFIVKRIADHLGQGIAFGQPLVRQERNEHDLFNDLRLEMLGMRVVDEFTGALAGLELSGDSYAKCAIEVCDALEPTLASSPSIDEKERAQLARFFAGYRVWANLPVWN